MVLDDTHATMIVDTTEATIAMTTEIITDRTGDDHTFLPVNLQSALGKLLFCAFLFFFFSLLLKKMYKREKKSICLVSDGDLHHHTTEEHTGLAQDPGLILLVSHFN